VPEFAVQTLNDLGFCDEKWWPYATSSPSDTAGPLEAERYSADQAGRLKAHAWNTPTDAKVALWGMGGVGGAPLFVGGLIDASYEQNATGLWVYSGTPIGGHAREVIGWDDDAGGFIEASSWGDGDTRVTAYDSICSDAVTQARFAIDWAPTFSDSNPMNG
jgi:hypothetical protein